LLQFGGRRYGSSALQVISCRFAASCAFCQGVPWLVAGVNNDSSVVSSNTRWRASLAGGRRRTAALSQAQPPAKVALLPPPHCPLEVVAGVRRAFVLSVSFMVLFDCPCSSCWRLVHFGCSK
jgi:hypothetical protein